ncbi:eukaryotic translation initiation factor 2-alpha kinase 1 isoform X1 [Pantherophis guttatus]|uniref:Eukaryotic translation initiation factor 2-alpha kinase 1 n=2 Tax=Pantherophis guttatus TaxID=94885 RepID=A0ABM3ZKG2_PANGU|nr:eukaryotic translation initiation factor 2-alpha kinase 1 isoform X1 [Pantherophis guttatus]
MEAPGSASLSTVAKPRRAGAKRRGERRLGHRGRIITPNPKSALQVRSLFAAADSDWPAEFRGANGSQKLMNIKSSFANQLLLVSLLEHLCHVYAQDPTRSRRLFQLLCKTFTQMGLLSDFAVCEEFSSLRLQHNRAITELMKAANKQIHNEDVGHGDSYKNRENEILFEAQTSRYVNEFDEISRLGKGGYGTVYKVRNKLDGQFYAIKKILIKKATKHDCMKVLREVKVLAQLQHPNIVGYHTAWMEHVQPACPKGGLVLDLPSLKMSSEAENSKDQSCIQEMEDSSIIFANPTPEDSFSRNSNRNEGNSCTLPSGTYGSSSDSDTSNDLRDNGNRASLLRRCDENGDHTNANDSCRDEDSEKEISSPQPCMTEYHLMLHIQMQLCETSLCDWIAARNDKCLRATDASNPYHHIEKHWTVKIFQELLEGVYYIHMNGVMHRDIKPRNIFLQGPNHHVKIGDFGLACRDIIEEDTTQLLSAENNYAFIHTSGVGTCLYASPEQLQGSHYDFKSDMYSLGVILFELFQPFGTEMERTKVLMGLRRGSLPLTFCGKWPIQARYVKLLTSDASSRRPTALQLLESELFHNSANVICALQQKVMKQEEEIKLLKEKIKVLLQEREERDRIKPLGSPV